AVLDRLVLVPAAEPVHHLLDALRPEDAHEVVFEAEVEARRAGIALAAGAAAQLVVDAPRLVPLGADDVQAPGDQHLLLLGAALRPVPLERRLVLGRGLVDAAG